MYNKKSIILVILSLTYLFGTVAAQEAQPQEENETFILHQQCINSNGESLKDGDTTTLFKASKDECEQQERTCVSGILDGDNEFQHYQCTVETKNENNCTRNNQTVEEFSTVVAYKEAIVSRDMSCSFVQKICIGGELQGPAEFMETSCQFDNRYSDGHQETHPDDYDKFGNIRPEVLLLPPVNNGNACTTAWGETVPSGETVISFDQQYGGLQGIREYKINLCMNGSFDGETRKYASAIHKNPDQQENNNMVAQKQLTACIERLQICDPDFEPTNFITTSDGFSGLDDEPCERDGKEIKNGESVTAYLKGTFKNGRRVCAEETRTCNNGELSGTYTETKCINPGGNGPHRCATPIGPLEHGKSLTLYKDSTVQHPGECVSIQRACEFGDLQGDDDYNQTSCKQVGDFCTTANGSVAHGDYAITYTKETVPYGVDCDDYKREVECTNGKLQGSFIFASCYAQDPKSCTTPDNLKVDHGQLVTRYQAQQVIGQPMDGQDECNRQARTCNDGKWLNAAGDISPFTFQYLNCNVVPPAGSNVNN